MSSLLHALNWKRITLAFCIAISALTMQTDHRVVGQELPVVKPVVSLVSVEPSSEVLEGSRLTVTLGINPPISLPVTEADKELLTGGRLIGGIRVWDSWKSPPQTYELIAFAFWPGDATDILRFSVCVADDGEAVQTGRTIRIDVNPVFAEYSVGSPSETTLRVLDKGPSGAEVPLRCPPGQEPPPPPPPPPPPIRLTPPPPPHSHAYTYAYSHSHAYTYAYSHSDAYAYSDSSSP